MKVEFSCSLMSSKLGMPCVFALPVSELSNLTIIKFSGFRIYGLFVYMVNYLMFLKGIDDFKGYALATDVEKEETAVPWKDDAKC